jgi:chromate transporter
MGCLVRQARHVVDKDLAESGDATDRRSSLLDLAGLFFKLGTIAFGGPAAHIAMMEGEVVRRRRWLTREEFLDYLGATNLIPGPNSTELAIHIGYARAGWPGLLVAGACFILPAALIVGVIAWAYVEYGKMPEVNGILYGVKPVVIAVIVQALYGLARTALKTRALTLLGAAAVFAGALGVHELLILFGAGLIMAISRAWFAHAVHSPALLLPEVARQWRRTGRADWSIAAVSGAPLAVAAPFGLWPLFWVFAKIGAVLFGSGYVLLAFLRADLVERLGWLTERQLLDAVAVGQVTPGPVFTTATFIGYVLGSAPGAVVATVGIFLPAFIFVALSGPLVPRLRRSRTAAAVLDGVTVASLALMAVVTWQLGQAALVDWLTLALAGLSAVLLLRFRVNSAWLVLGGALAGLMMKVS